MTEVVYDVPISEAAKILEKSDRQVRRYVKEKRLKARPVRVDGHIKLMFSREELDMYKERLTQGEYFGDTGREIVVDAQLIDEAEGSTEARQEPEVIVLDEVDSAVAVKYVIDAMKEQIHNLRKENKDLYYQLEQRSGQVGFLQGRIEGLQEEIKALMPVPKSEPEVDIKRSWYKRMFGRHKTK